MTNRVHLPQKTPVSNARAPTTGSLNFPDFAGLALIYNEPVTGWQVAPSSPNVGLVALTNNEFLWYTAPTPLTPFTSTRTFLGVDVFGRGVYDTNGYSGGARFFYGVASVSPDGTVTREGATMTFNLPYSAGNPFAPVIPFGPIVGYVGDGYTSWGTLLDVAPGGKFLFSGVFCASAGIPDMIRRGTSDGTSVLPYGNPTIPTTSCDALFLVEWNGAELVLSAQTAIFMESAFLAAADATQVYGDLLLRGNTPPLPFSGILQTRTSASVWSLSGSTSPLGSRIPTTGWGTFSTQGNSLNGACFCGDSILIAVVDYLQIYTQFFAEVVSQASAAYLVTADASTLIMSTGVDITARLTGNSDFPVINHTFGSGDPTQAVTVPYLQGAQYTTYASTPPVTAVSMGIVSALLAAGNIQVSTDRVGYSKVLVQVNGDSGILPGAWYYGTSDYLGNIILTAGEFLGAQVGRTGTSSPGPGFSRTQGSPQGVGTIIPYPGNTFSYNPAAFPSSQYGPIGLWAPQRHYWTPFSPDEVFGLLYVSNGVDTGSGFGSTPAWGVLRADASGSPTFDFLPTGIESASSPPNLPPTAVLVPLSNSALQSGASGTYNLIGFDTGVAGVYNFFALGSSIAETIFSQPWYIEGSVSYSGGVVQNSNIRELFETDLTDDSAVAFLVGSAVVPFCDAVTLQNGQVVFAAQAQGSSSTNRGFYLWGGKVGSFQVPTGDGPAARVSTTAAPQGVGVWDGNRTHLPDVGTTSAKAVTGPGGSGGGGAGPVGGGGTGDGGGATGGTGAPAITNSAPASITIGVVLGFTFTATGGAPITWTHTGTLPANTTLDPATGYFSGIPNTLGSSTFQVTATNALGSDTSVPNTVTVVAASVGGPLPTSPSGPAAPGAGFRRVFADDFVGSSLDTSRWSPTREPGQQFSGGYQTWEQETFDSSKVSVSGSNLILTCVPEVANGKNYCSGTVEAGLASNGFRFSPSIGGPFYIQGRIKIPGDAPGSNGSGFPAFWCVTYLTGYTREMDFFEFGLQPRPGQRDQMDSTQLAPPSYGGSPVSNVQNPNMQLPFDPAAAFHVYTVQINTNGSFTLWIDGTHIWDLGAYPAIDYMSIILNYSLINTPPASNFVSDTYECDYVIVWQDASVPLNQGVANTGVAAGTV